MDNTTEYCYNLLKPNGRIKEICQDEPIIDESTITNDGFTIPDDSSYDWYIDGELVGDDPNFSYELNEDKPWYQDAWDMATMLWTHQWIQAIAAILALIMVVGFVWWMVGRARWINLADDNYDVEDYIEQLNEAAAERGGSAEYSASDDQYAMG